MNTTDELDAFFERVPEHVLDVVDQAYFEYIDRSRLPGRGRALPEGGPAGRRPAHVLEDLRPRRPARRLRGRRRRASAPRWRRCAARSTSPRPRRSRRSRASASDAELARRRAVNAEGLAPPRSRCCASTAWSRSPSVGNFLYVDTGGDANALYEQLLHEGVIVRPLTGFGVADGDPRLGRHARRARPPRGRARTGAAAGLIAFAPSAQPPDEDAAHRAAASACSSSRRSAPASARGWRRSRSPSTSTTARTRRGG